MRDRIISTIFVGVLCVGIMAIIYVLYKGRNDPDFFIPSDDPVANRALRNAIELDKRVKELLKEVEERRKAERELREEVRELQKLLPVEAPNSELKRGR